MEKISFVSAAQRCGCSVAEIEQLIKDKKLKEVAPGKVDKEALLALSGITPSGHQTKKSASKKPNVMTFEATAAYLNTDIAGVKELVEEGVLEVAEGAGGVRGPKEAQVKMYKKKLEGVQLLPKEVRETALGKCKKCEVKYNEHDLKEVTDAAYKMGKLAVYESISEFKGKVQS